ncbi:MAG: 1-acyl-sn-glycerol-3-phosphate acyltransferase [Butyrivibrio sp.]|nr:1-acyl-sn-glycerol-3-phosphate acyltransferase [Acetatifactor muris]MCM1558179.1 1-acyl-sn-glycerol-3-phosphate acyltransferase [Butyrivibrio sp.]
MIRFIVIVLYLVLYLILSLPVLFVEWIIGKFNPRLKAESSMALVSWGFRCITALAGTKVIVRGRENIPTDTAVLYAGNHRSFFDIVLTCTLFPRVTGYVAKLEMKKAPILSLWMKNIHCLFLDRKNIREGLKTILAGVEEVKNGYSLCIFPEGTRNKVNDTFLPFKEGSFKIAEKGGVPIVPLTLVNTAQVFEEHLPKVKKAAVVIDFGEAVYPEQLEKDVRKNLGNHVLSLIRERYFEIKKEYNL